MSALCHGVELATGGVKATLGQAVANAGVIAANAISNAALTLTELIALPLLF